MVVKNMKFEVDESTHLLLNEKGEFATDNEIVKLVNSIKLTSNIDGKRPNYKTPTSLEVIIYDGSGGFMIQDIVGLQIIEDALNPSIRVPSKEEKQKFLDHAKLVKI